MAALGMSGGAAGFEVDLTDPDRTDLLQEAFDALPVTDSALRSAVAARLSVALTFTGAEHRRRHLADDAVAMARRIHDPRALATALAAQCDAFAGPDHIDVRRAAADEIITCARTVHDRTMELLGRRMRLVALAEAGELGRGADDQIRSYAAVSEPTRQPGLNWYLPLWRGMRAAMRGDRPAQDEQAAELQRLVAFSGSKNALLLEGTQHLVRAIDAGRPRRCGSLARAVHRRPSRACVCRPTDLRAAVGAHRLHRRGTWRLAAYVRGLRDRVKDSEWLPEVVQAAMTSIALRDRDAAATIY